MFTKKDKIDVLIDEQNKKISLKAKIQAKSKAKLSALENKIDQLQIKSEEIRRTTEYKVDNLDFEIKELGDMITLKACTNAKKKSLKDDRQKVPKLSEKEKEIIKNTIEKNSKKEGK